MEITKFEHACFTVTKHGDSIVVDPGAFTTDFVMPARVVGVVVTHVHPDHMSQKLIKKIVEANPDALVLGPEQAVSDLDDIDARAVKPGETATAGSFDLAFFGGDHALIIDGIPIDENVGVLIDGRVYYPGDSFALPDTAIDVLALPVSAPWLKMNDAATFLKAVKPKITFPTHDAILSAAGKGLPDDMLASVAKDIGTTYKRLEEPLAV